MEEGILYFEILLACVLSFSCFFAPCSRAEPVCGGNRHTLPEQGSAACRPVMHAGCSRPGRCDPLVGATPPGRKGERLRAVARLCPGALMGT